MRTTRAQDQPEIDLDFLLHREPTLDQIRDFWRRGEFHEEQYLVAAIRRHLRTEIQAHEMVERGFSIEDLLNGRVPGDHSLWVAVVFGAWNQKLGFTAFGEGERPPAPSVGYYLVQAIWKDHIVEGMTAARAAAAIAVAAGWVTDAVREARPEERESAATWGSTGVEAIQQSAVAVTGMGEAHLMVTVERNPLPKLPDVFVVYAPRIKEWQEGESSTKQDLLLRFPSLADVGAKEGDQ